MRIDAGNAGKGSVHSIAALLAHTGVSTLLDSHGNFTVS